MQIIKIKAFENGAHANQKSDFISVPGGYALIPETMQIPDSFPFVDIETQEQGGVFVVTKMTARDIPEPAASEPAASEPAAPTVEEQLAELQSQVKTLEAKNTALTTSNQFLEDCIAEMAETVYQ